MKGIGGTAIPKEKIFPDLEVTANIKLREDYKNKAHIEYFALIYLKHKIELKNEQEHTGDVSKPIIIQITKRKYDSLQTELSKSNSINPELMGKSKLEFSAQTSESAILPGYPSL